MSETNNWQPPAWLNAEYMEQILKSYLNDDTIHIQNIDVRPATESGENYASVMGRIRVTYICAAAAKKAQELSFILKCTYESDPFVSNILGSYDIYNTEMKMYERILPQLVEILADVGETEQLFAKTLKVEYEKSAILFEDLTMKNYVVVDRLKGLDETHTRMALKKLAKFHAAAAVLNERLNGKLEQYDRGIFNRHVKGLAPMFEYFTEMCAIYAKTCPELGPYYYDKLMKLRPHMVDYGIKAYNNNSKHFFTLSHGDLWTTNIMMLYDKSTESEMELKDLLLIDFQFSNWSSPAVDLHYFFSTSLEPKLMLDISVEQTFVQHYHMVLQETLRKLNYQGHIPTLHELCVQVEEGRFLAVTASLTNLAVAIADQCDGADFHCLVDDVERAKIFRSNCYKNKRFLNIIKAKLPYFDRLGLLDVQE